MPTAVLDLEFEHLPAVIAVPGHYDRALILVRVQGRPVGQVRLPVTGGQIGGAELRDALAECVTWPFWEERLHEYLGWNTTGTPTTTLPSATVAICTRDRPDDVRRCLEGIRNLPDDGQEVLVVDNCPSTDATRRFVEEYASARYVREDRPGLDIARNRALLEARHEIVAFVDDDAVPDPNWLRTHLRNFDDPTVLCVTGLTMPLELETEAQEWFERYSAFGRGFRRIVFDEHVVNPLAAGRVGAGANMSLRRSVVDLVGPFDEALDGGTAARSGGDTEMFSRILAQGYRIVYDPAALNWHRHRRTWEELRQTIYGYGVGVYALWTRRLVFERELTIPKLAWGWFRHTQLPALARALLKRTEGSGQPEGPGQSPAEPPPLDLLLAELRGCANGPWAYLASRWRQRRNRHPLEATL